MKFKIFCIFIVFAAIFSSCRPTKHVPKDKYLLNNVKIHSDVKNQTEQELKRYLRQTPNSRSLGLFRLRLGVYNISGRDSTKFNRFFQKLGDAPIIYDSIQTNRSVTELKKYLSNKGYLDATIDYEVFYRKRKVRVEYNVTGNRPYRVGSFYYNIRNNDTILNIIRSDSSKTLVRKGMLFDADVLNNERQRITTQLKNSGYYDFNREYLRYRADSLGQDHIINLRMAMRNATKTDTAGQTVNVPHRQYYVRKVHFYTTYDPIVGTDFSSIDSLTCRCHTFYFNGNIGIRPDILLDNCYIESGKLYNESQVEKTYSALNILPAIKYVNIRMLEIGNSDTLDCFISTSPARPQQYSIDVEGTTNSDWDFGFAGILGYQHKNLFRGSETFKTSFRFAHERLTTSMSEFLDNKNSSNEFGIETSLTFPKFLFPFSSYDFRRKIRASTEFNLQYNYHRRPEYGRTAASAGVKYHWSQNKDMRHTVDLINVNYIYLPYVSSAFRDEYLSDRFLKYSYENQLIVSNGYSFYYNHKFLRDNITARARIESAGNTLYGIAKVFDFKKVDNSYTIGDIKFTQYIKTDLNFAYDKYIDYRNKIVYHAGIGIGVPYGNASVLPFEKRYFAGGANSMRGWNVRTLGPGVYKNKNENGHIDYMNQSGDMKLDVNLEYRFKMFWVMEGALFADAGNIWTLTDYNTQPGGVFRFGEFLKQTALSYGVGLRFDFNFFLVRVDMGVKTYNPALDGKDKWRFKGLNWDDDFAFHFAIGYPF